MDNLDIPDGESQMNVNGAIDLNKISKFLSVCRSAKTAIPTGRQLGLHGEEEKEGTPLILATSFILKVQGIFSHVAEGKTIPWGVNICSEFTFSYSGIYPASHKTRLRQKAIL